MFVSQITDTTSLQHFYPCSPHRLGCSFLSSLLGQPLQHALHGESLRPPGQGLPVSPHVEVPPQRCPHHSADASKRGGSLGVHQVNTRLCLYTSLYWLFLFTALNQSNTFHLITCLFFFTDYLKCLSLTMLSFHTA